MCRERLRLSLSGVSGARVRVQRSGNLADWEDWQNSILGPASGQLDAGTNGFEGRFDRAFEAPPRPDEGN